MDKQTVLEDFQHYYQWLSLLENMEKETWTMPIAPDKWSCQEIIAHIMKWDDYLLSYVIPSIIDGADMFFPEYTGLMRLQQHMHAQEYLRKNFLKRRRKRGACL